MERHTRNKNAMKNLYTKINRKHYSLGELVEIVSSCARDSRETVAAVADLFESGRVQLKNHGTLKRVRIAA
jgi:hypothetical protein